MIVTKDKKDLLVAIDELKRSEKKITLIPTMGNLHEGHKTLIKMHLEIHLKLPLSMLIHYSLMIEMIIQTIQDQLNAILTYVKS